MKEKVEKACQVGGYPHKIWLNKAVALPFSKSAFAIMYVERVERSLKNGNKITLRPLWKGDEGRAMFRNGIACLYENCPHKMLSSLGEEKSTPQEVSPKGQSNIPKNIKSNPVKDCLITNIIARTAITPQGGFCVSI